MDLAVLSGHIKNHKYLTWFSAKWKVIKIIFVDVTEIKDSSYDIFSLDRKLIKTVSKCERFRWLISVDESWKSHPKQFWKHISQFKKKNTDLIHLDIDPVVLNTPRDVAEAFSIGS
jgi:hypothetical protein